VRDEHAEVSRALAHALIKNVLGVATTKYGARARARARSRLRPVQPMPAAIGLSFWMFLTSCGSSSGNAPEAATPLPSVECTHRLGPRSVAHSAGPPSGSVKIAEPPMAARRSRLIVHANLSLTKLGAELEKNIAPRLADGNAVSLGPAGVLDYSVDRGPFALSIARDHLVVETPVYGRARACRGGRCYAGCEPRALVRAEIPLWLGADYRFGRSRVALEFTSGCRVRALGGMLNIDVTPLLESALAPRLERVRREIDGRLPDVRAEVERGWRQLATPRPLPTGGCLVVDPLGLVQGPVQQSGDEAHARFALLARPELRSDCSAPAVSTPLPPLSADPALPDEDVVTLGMGLPLASLALGFESAIHESGPRYHVAEAAVEAIGESVAAELELRGEVCGAVAFRAEPTFAGEEGLIELTAGTLDTGENERLRAAGLDPEVLVQQLTRLPRLAAPISLPILRAAPSALAWLFSDPALSLSARVSSLRAAGASAHGEQLVAWVEARGSLWLEQK
jgi:hypothetical protein